MSTFEPKHDHALLAVPWLSKETATGRWLFKYAPHPDRAGYVFVATNLEMVFFESLTAPSIPSRLTARRSASQSQSTQATSSQREETDIVCQAEKVLETLDGEIMRASRGWAQADVQVEEHAFFDRIVNVTLGSFDWVFNMTELKSPLPLMFITNHLLAPLASALHPRDVSGSTQDATPIDLIGALLEDPEMTERLERSSKLATTAQHARKKRTVRTIPEEEPVVQPESVMTARSRSPSRVLETPIDEDKGADLAGADEAEVEEEYKSPEPSPPPQPTSKTRSKARTPEEATTRPGDTGSSPVKEKEEEYNSPPSPVPASPIAEPSRTRKAGSAKLVDTDTERPQRARTRTVTPPGPTPTQTSQRTKREREREEEEALERRKEEMKRKMGSGRGGRLGRRRAG